MFHTSEIEVSKNFPIDFKCRLRHNTGDTLVVFSLSRLARSVEELLKINRELLDRGITLKSLSEPIDTRTADGKLIFNVRAALAQFERDVTVERTRAGIAEMRRKGRLVGRPPKITDDIKKRIKRDMLAMKLTIHQICRKYKITKQAISYHFPGGRQGIGKRP